MAVIIILVLVLSICFVTPNFCSDYKLLLYKQNLDKKWIAELRNHQPYECVFLMGNVSSDFLHVYLVHKCSWTALLLMLKIISDTGMLVAIPNLHFMSRSLEKFRNCCGLSLLSCFLKRNTNRYNE